MSASIGRFFTRAPRYLFRPHDHSLLRYATLATTGVSHTTLIHDLSETGLSFLCSFGVPPEEGEVLKLEFTVPGRKQIACFATVVRVEQRSVWSAENGDALFYLVAIQFRNLPFAHRRALQVGLQPRTRDSEDAIILDSEHRRHGYILTGMSALFIGILYWMCLTPDVILHLFKQLI